MPKLIERIRAVAFDLDGTLIDTMADLAAALNLTLTMLGAPEIPEARVRALVGNGVEQLVLRGLAESLGDRPTHPAQRSAAMTLFRRLYTQRLFTRSQVFPGAAQALQSLMHSGVLLCCITNKDSAFTEPLLKQAGLARYFVFTLCADRPEDRKPSPRLLLAACSRFGIAPAQMLYVGDSSVDIAAARAAGCPVVAVSYGYDSGHAAAEQRPERSEGNPEKRLWGDAGQPDGFVEKLTDLLALSVRSSTDQPHLKLCITGAT